jgi:hypothetical protein
MELDATGPKPSCFMINKHIGKDKIARVMYQKDSKLYVKRKCDDGAFKYVAIRSAIGLSALGGRTVSKLQ